MNPIKLTIAEAVSIKPGATGLIKVKEEVTIPLNAVGKFFIRLTLGKLGLIPSDSPFRPGWTGVPEGIVVTNAGSNLVEIPAGRELGEIYMLALAVTQEDVTETLLDNLEKHRHPGLQKQS
jgi:deoxycytidine triphosphate deaminase